jgi:hypothetical protein
MSPPSDFDDAPFGQKPARTTDDEFDALLCGIDGGLGSQPVEACDPKLPRGGAAPRGLSEGSAPEIPELAAGGPPPALGGKADGEEKDGVPGGFVPSSLAKSFEALGSKAVTESEDIEKSVHALLEGAPPSLQVVPELPKSEAELLFEQAVKDGGKFDLRGCMGGWWVKALKQDPELKKKYSDLGKSYEMQRQFRANWAARQANELREEREMSQTSVDVDEKAVTYQPLSCIWREEGGLAADWGPACRYVAKCISLAESGVTCRNRPWVLYNDFTCRYEFAYVKKAFRSSFIQKWTMLSTSRGAIADASSSGTHTAGSGATPKSVAGTALSEGSAKGGSDKEGKKCGKDDKALQETADGGKDDKKGGTGDKDKGSKKRGGGDGPQQDGAAKKLRQDLQGLWKRATDVRSKASSTIASFHALEQNISMDSNWGWAEGKEQGSLRALKQDLDQFARSSVFWRDFFLVDMVALKKKYAEPGEVSKHLLGLQECSDKIMALNKQARKMMSMHDALLKA